VVAFFVLRPLMVILMQLGVVRWFDLHSLLNQTATLVLCNLSFVFLLACVTLTCWAFIIFRDFIITH